MTTKFSDEELMAYVDGEVDDEKAQAIEAAAAADPGIARTIDMFARSRMVVQNAFSSVLQETVPPQLVASALGQAAKEEPVAYPGNVVRFRLRRPSVLAVAMATAACLAMIAAGVAGYVVGSGSSDAVDGIELAAASDEISGLLGRMPAGAQQPLKDGPAFSVIGSFRDGDGRFCREFELSGDRKGAVAVACRTDGEWAVEFAMQKASAGGYEPASSTAVLDSYLAQIGAGPVLSAEDERALLDRTQPGQ